MPTHTEPENQSTQPVAKSARSTPLTEEVKAHLQATASLAENRYAVIQAMVEAAIMPLVEANRHVEFDVKLSDEEVSRIVSAVRGALDYGHAQVVEPIYSRLRGERPYVEETPDPSTEGEA